jgi:signal transduction histidine kinase
VLLLGAKRTDEFFSPQDRQLLGTLAGQAALAVKNVRLVAELRARMAELAEDRQELQAAYRHLTRSREEERHRLAGELHDAVIQDLMALKLELVRCARMAGGDVARDLDGLADRISDIADLIRGICAGLRPAVLDLGLGPALQSHLRRFGEETGLEVELVDDQVGPLPEEVTVSLFRVAQEALNNVRRHAQACSVWVHLTATPERLELSIDDDGVGFEPGPALADGEAHFGLRHMREYVEALGGQLSLHSQPGRGTTVTARVPRSATEWRMANGGWIPRLIRNRQSG